MVVHPEVGKWLIALGEKAFGMDPFGWRISAAVVGSLMVLVMCRLARRLTGSTLLGCVAGLLLCFDGLHLVLSRLALLDIFLAFFLLCAVRAWSPTGTGSARRMAALVPARPTSPAARCRAAVPALAARRRRLLGTGHRHQVDRALPAGRLRACWSGCGAPARGDPSASAGRCSSAVLDGVPRSSTSSCVGLRRVRRVVDRLAGARPRVRAAASRPRSTPGYVSDSGCKGGDTQVKLDDSKRWKTATPPVNRPGLRHISLQGRQRPWRRRPR